MAFIYAPRLRTFDYVGYYRYFLTICTFERSRVLVSAAAVDALVRQLSQTADAYRFEVIAYCLMPDHLHALVARYIIENPVRAGLAASPLEYPYLGSMTTSVRDLLYSVQIQRT